MTREENFREQILTAAQELAAATDREALLAAAVTLQQHLSLLLSDEAAGGPCGEPAVYRNGTNGHAQQALPSVARDSGLSPESLAEALLFVAPEPLEVTTLARLLELEEPEAYVLLDRLSRQLSTRGIRLQRAADGRLQLVSAPQAGGLVERLLGVPAGTRLSAAALETLAIVAYRQPVTRAQIEAIRGVDSSAVVRALLARGLISEAGRAETVGRPILYATTSEFLNQFGLESLGDLPPLELPDV